MPLYTVQMFRQQFVYSYDDRGRRVNERVEQVAVTITDLPHSTAIGYQFKFPKNGVTITQQFGSDSTPRRSASRDYYEREDDVETSTVDLRKVELDRVTEAAISGDMGAAISGEAA